MSDQGSESEDKLIRLLLYSGATAAVAGFLLTVLLVAVMISANFNFLEWME